MENDSETGRLKAKALDFRGPEQGTMTITRTTSMPVYSDIVKAASNAPLLAPGATLCPGQVPPPLELPTYRPADKLKSKADWLSTDSHLRQPLGVLGTWPKAVRYSAEVP